MHHWPIPLGVILAFGAFSAFWITIVRLMRRLSRMTDAVPADAGPMLQRSGWGSATINGARAQNCVRVIEYANGHAVKMHPIFGGGMVWLPRGQTQHQGDGDSQVELRHAKHVVRLTGKLARFTGLAPGAPVKATPQAAEPAHAVQQHRTPDTPRPIDAGLRRTRDSDGGGAFSRFAILVAVLLLAYVVLRRQAPDVVAPIEALIQHVFS